MPAWKNAEIGAPQQQSRERHKAGDDEPPGGARAPRRERDDQRQAEWQCNTARAVRGRADTA